MGGKGFDLGIAVPLRFRLQMQRISMGLSGARPRHGHVLILSWLIR